MRDTILTAALTFSLLAGGTAAIGTELVRVRTAQAPAPVVVLPTVTVVGQRASAAQVVMLPTVTVTGRKAAAGDAATRVAAETVAPAATRVE